MKFLSAVASSSLLNLQPTLTGPHVLLRPLTDADYEASFAVASDPLVWEQHPASDRYQPEVFKKFFVEAIECKGAFAIIDRETQKLIGQSRFYKYDPIKSEVEIGYTFYARAYWGGALNREVKKLMLMHAYEKVERVVFNVGSTNFRSQKATLKIGGVFLGEETVPDGKGGMRVNFVYCVPKEAAIAL